MLLLILVYAGLSVGEEVLVHFCLLGEFGGVRRGGLE